LKMMTLVVASQCMPTSGCRSLELYEQFHTRQKLSAGYSSAMQRIMFSGGSSLSTSGHRGKKHHCINTYVRKYQRLFEVTWFRTSTAMKYQQPLMESCVGDMPLHAYAPLIVTMSTTCMNVYMVSVVKIWIVIERCATARYLVGVGTSCNICSRTNETRRLCDLPHEIVGGKYPSCYVERRVERVLCKIDPEGVRNESGT
jgi:hypothetical protein